jgi:hypothetical protein
MPPHNPGSGHRRTHDQRAAHNNDDVVAKSGEGVIVWDDADEHRGKECHDRHKIVSEPAGDEEHHHSADDRES